MLKHNTIEEADEERMGQEEQLPAKETGAEEQTETKKKPIKEIVLDYWQIAIKILELILCVVCTGLIIDPLKTANAGSIYLNHYNLIFTTYNGYIIIISVTLLGRLFGDRLSFKTNSLFSLVAAGLFLTSACLILSDHTDFGRKYLFYPNRYMLDMMCTSASFAIVNALIFAVDSILTFRLQSDL